MIKRSSSNSQGRPKSERTSFLRLFFTNLQLPLRLSTASSSALCPNLPDSGTEIKKAKDSNAFFVG